MAARLDITRLRRLALPEHFSLATLRPTPPAPRLDPVPPARPLVATWRLDASGRLLCEWTLR